MKRIIIEDNVRYELLLRLINFRTLYTLSKEEIIMEIMNIDGLLLEQVDEKDKTFRVCFEAVLNNNNAINYIPRTLKVNELKILHNAILKEKKTYKNIVSPVKLVNQTEGL